MQDEVGEAGDAGQAGPVVEVGDHRRRPARAPSRGTRRVAQQGEDAEASGEAGQDAATSPLPTIRIFCTAAF
jgi:hypothetical protein